ncbi:hypothetical protein TrLO_g6994 [Triparma laevis f. longispina]|uniref:Uncharacterized protein n=1 Tax=Triparma laevis f. longispina TaxID=1714387 RepID=A0A9W7KRI7_9STRA|nr:hypothetical protein TrLO_g6994 [Triparma laevis f. longispina]
MKLLHLLSILLPLTKSEDPYLSTFIAHQSNLTTSPFLRLGIRSLTPLKSKPSTTYFIALPLTEVGESYYPGQSVLDAVWGGGSWSLRETAVAECE